MNKLLILISILLISYSNIYSQWVEQTSGVSRRLNDINGQPNLAYWICGDSGTVLKSTDHGTTWNNLSGHGIPNNVNLTGIYELYTSERAVTCGNSNNSSFIFLTSNGGNNWIQIFSE